jgi:hypothetical protein
VESQFFGGALFVGAYPADYQDSIMMLGYFLLSALSLFSTMGGVWPGLGGYRWQTNILVAAKSGE